ncbi:MOSC domain-containing protein [Mycolicibacterium baixiangningiae]|uniref:MOSC domain-containing protein n=1 Tax=Mycolicibacterium baixiangningiae TaxID=2761578 RepID=UPI0018693EC1|nr:MOSC domain-containing protein [Mycolicibacterium baixiangningiae]
MTTSASGHLVSVNVGFPRDVQWQDKTVHTGVWKAPVDGPVMVRRLNIDGDGQGDLNGHGGENRAVLVYQNESYDHWRAVLERDDLTPGCFGENFTVDGLPDDAVCIGDRYRIGDAEFEVTQPRVTCFRVGMRLGEPRMPNLLVSHHRPGFYLRVIAEGMVTAGDEIVRTQRGPHALSVADVDALLYLPGRDVDTLRRAVDLPALSPGWVQSFRELLDAHGTTGPAWQGFRKLRVVATRHETEDVLSIDVESADGVSLLPALPGQYLTVRVSGAGQPAPLRSYSLSGDSSAGRYRISVKREAHGLVSRWLHAEIRVGSTIDCAAPRGDFVLVDEERPVVLLSAGVGCTPVLAMLHRLAAERSARRVIWVHTTRDRESHAFAAEVDRLLTALPDAAQHVVHTASGPRLDGSALAAMDLPTDAAIYLCGPAGFMDTMRAALVASGMEPTRIHSELFGARAAINPGVTDAPPAVRPHAPPGVPGDGPAVTFARTGLTVNWSRDYRSLLDLAEACDVPTRYSCRSGVCHICVTDVIAGTAEYAPPPLEEPPDGSVLICSAIPTAELVLDL